MPNPTPLHHTVGAHLEADVTEPAEVVLSIATTRAPGGDDPGVTESLTITVDGTPVPTKLALAPNATRLQLLREVPPGKLVVDYQADLIGEPELPSDEPVLAAADRIVHLRPSRYCESDTLAAVAAAEFSGLDGKDLLDAVSSWVGQRLAYVASSSRPTDGAVETYLARQGVCRDFAHLVIALLRAQGVPARLASVYAPGLAPMDFHAVAEARLDDGWYVVDATALAPRTGMVRIATGRDASDTAFMTVHSGRVDLTGMEVTATILPALPEDDVTRLVRLS